MVRLGALWRKAAALLEQAGVEDAAFDARELCRLCCKADPLLAPDFPVPEAAQQRLAQLCARRARHEPLQYLLGARDFLDFTVEEGPGVLIPRADTECVAQTAVAALKRAAARPGREDEPAGLDLCAGTGVLAIALASEPAVLLADEPTTALDVTIQAQIFELMEKLKREHDTAIMLITHDMGVVSELADDVAVMYMGSIVERGSVREVLKYPAHPYTAALLRSIPILHKGRGQRLEPIRGSTPDPYDRPKGCQFAPRCDFCCEKCRQEMPPEVPVCDGHAVRCWNAEQVYAGHREEVEAV